MLLLQNHQMIQTKSFVKELLEWYPFFFFSFMKKLKLKIKKAGDTVRCDPTSSSSQTMRVSLFFLFFLLK